MRWARAVAAVAVVAVAGGAAYVSYRLVKPDAPGVTASAVPHTTPSPTASPSPPPEPTLAWGPTVSEWEQALADAHALTLEQAAGQVLVAGWSSPDPASAAAYVESLHLGGLVLMSGAIDTAEQVAELTSTVAAVGDRDWPVMMGTDQEGGTVSRLTGVIPDMPGFMAAGALADAEEVRTAYANVGADMHRLGFTLNFAPVADVTVGMADPTIRSRSAGSHPDAVASTVVASMQGYLDGGVVPVLKHFPGHGSVTVDSHAALPVHSATVSELEARDLIPFTRAIAAGAPAIMMGHLVVPEWGEAPASLSPAAHAYVRQTLGFDGVIVTDAVNMGAVTGTYGAADAVVLAVAAGADVVLMPADPAAARDALVAAVTAGTLPRERLDEAAARSILLMRWQDTLEAIPGDPSGQYASVFAAHATTVAAATCTGPWVGSTVAISGGVDSDREALANAFAVLGVTQAPGGTTVRLLGADDRAGNASVVIALGGPWGLPQSQADVYVGLFGRSPDAFAGVARVLVGLDAPQGTWPVDMTGVPYPTCGGVASTG